MMRKTFRKEGSDLPLAPPRAVGESSSEVLVSGGGGLLVVGQFARVGRLQCAVGASPTGIFMPRSSAQIWIGGMAEHRLVPRRAQRPS